MDFNLKAFLISRFDFKYKFRQFEYFRIIIYLTSSYKLQ